MTNKRVFAVPIQGAPSGIKCDDRGLVYAGCADGIEVWNAGGVLQAVIEIAGKLETSQQPFADSSTPGDVAYMLTDNQEASPISASADATRRGGRCLFAPSSDCGGCALAAPEIP